MQGAGDGGKEHYMKVVVVGGVAGGASAAARVRRIDASAEIVMFEKGPHVSFSNCALPYYLSGTVAESEELILMDPEAFANQHDIDARVSSEVLSIDRQAKTVRVRNLISGEEYDEPYDKLVLSPGANPILPGSIEGIGGENVFTVRNVVDIEKLKSYIVSNGLKEVAVVGGGFIGIEVAENLCEAGYKVKLIEGLDQIMAPFDHDMVQILHKEMDDKGVELHLGSTVTAIAPDHVKVSGKDGDMDISADAVVMSIGVAPDVKLAKQAGLEIGETRAIKVNDHYQTSDPDIYAVGDAIESTNRLTGAAGRLALAGPAQRQARAAANHIYGIADNNQNSFIGSSCIRVFEQNAASTGLNERSAKAAGLNYDSVLVFPNDMVKLMPDANYMAFKLVFSVPDGKILGAQAIGKGNVTKRVDVIAAMITMGATVDDLRELELCYSPVFGTAKDVVNLAAFVAQNILDGVFEQVHVCEVRGLVERGAYIIDVRNEDEFEEGHIKGAVNIPLGQIRKRMDEIPKDKPVYLHCRSSQRSYYALCALKGNGFGNIINISGSFLGISLYEYYRDKAYGREPIVTAYNFE